MMVVGLLYATPDCFMSNRKRRRDWKTSGKLAFPIAWFFGKPIDFSKLSKESVDHRIERIITYKNVSDTATVGSQHAALNSSSHALRIVLSLAPENTA